MITTATVVAATVAKQLNLGSIVALLVVGMALGPHSPKPLLTAHVDELQTVGEIGVMLLLFLVGLETKPESLSSMRRLLFGLGTAQYVLTSAAIVGLLLAFAHLHWQSALIIALGLAMSSDAIAISSLEEHAGAAAPHGRAVTAVLILQCFMAVAVLALIPLLAASPTPGVPLPRISKALEVCTAIAGVYLFARYVLPWVLSMAARRQGMEAFTLIIISAVFATAWVMDAVGLSSALGALWLGMILSPSVFAYQIKASVSLLKGLLFRVFFIAIGMSINLDEVLRIGGELVFYLPTLLLMKIAVVLGLGLLFRLGLRASVLAGILLAPFDEIAYVVFSSAHGSGLLSERAYAMGLMGISFSFVVSPVLVNLGYNLVDRLTPEKRPELPLTASTDWHDHVVVVGYSYVGRVICLMLERAKVPFIAMDGRLDRIDVGRREKHTVFYGDVTDPAVMDALAISRARAVIVTASDFSAVRRVIGNLRQFHPGVEVMTAVSYLFQRDELRKAGAARVVALTPEGTLSFGRSVLGELGIQSDSVEAILDSMRAADYASVRSVGGASVPEDVPEQAAAGKESLGS